VIEVSDEGRWREGRRNDGGRGLELMRRLMDEVVIDQTDSGTAVRQRLEIGKN
jgi:anti-sigma regulatory factor (Ser/Thr protein kinase)